MGKKFYSPDIKTFSFEGRSGVFGTLSSIIVAPIRVVLRVMHNIFILPANLVGEYAKSLGFTSLVFLGIAIIDFFVRDKWPMIIAPIPCLVLSFFMKKAAANTTDIAEEKYEVDIDTEQIEELCNQVVPELENI